MSRAMSPTVYESDLMVAYGNFIFRHRDKIFPVALIALFLAFPTRLFLGGSAIDLWGDILALALGLAGEALRVATVGLDYIKRGGLNKKVYASRLVTGGLFAHCRNPLYVGNVVLALALLLMLDNIVAFLFGAAVVVGTYIAIVAAEERYLRGQFGADYDAYCAAVNRWLPQLQGLGETFRGARFNWQRVLLKEFSSFYGWVAAAFAIELAGAWLDRELGELDVMIYAVLFMVATMAFLAIRLARRTGWLQMPHA